LIISVKELDCYLYYPYTSTKIDIGFGRNRLEIYISKRKYFNLVYFSLCSCSYISQSNHKMIKISFQFATISYYDLGRNGLKVTLVKLISLGSRMYHDDMVYCTRGNSFYLKYYNHIHDVLENLLKMM
jgi:hypothetical protein